MHFPVTFSLGSFSLPLHTLTETLGIFIGFRYFLWLRKKKGDTIEDPNRVWILIAALFGAIFGSRLIGGLENIEALQQAPNKWWFFYNNKTVVGGFVGGLFGVELMKLVLKEKKPSGDLFTYPIIIALIIGRIGCFSMGVYEETYGIASTLPWAMNLGDGILRHPVCLYEILFLIVLMFSIKRLEKRYTLKQGARFKIFMIAYLFFRLFIELIKPQEYLFLHISTIQLTCLTGLVWYLPHIIHPKKLFFSTLTYKK